MTSRQKKQGGTEKPMSKKNRENKKRMKKLLFTISLSALLLSWGGSDDYCGCAKEAADMAKEAGSDADKVKAAAEKATECTKMLEGKSAEELAEMSKDCTDLLGK